MPVLLITGANRGIGLEFVRQYAAEGWNVIACCRVLETAKALQVLAKSNSAIRIEKLDVSDSDAIKNLAQKLKDVAIDLLINNAGILSGANGFTSALDSDVSQTFGTIDPEAWGKVRTVIENHERTARDFQDKKDSAVVTATWLGVSAVLTLILGYVIGFSAVVGVYAQTTALPKSQSSEAAGHPTPVPAPAPAAPK